jgi:hypothetical protein
MKRFGLVLLIVVLPMQLHAQRAYTGAGAGSIECGSYLKARQQKSVADEDVVAQWAWGYMSAYNFFSSHKQVRVISQDTLLAYMDKFCKDNPLSVLSQGINGLIGDLGGWKPK